MKKRLLALLVMALVMVLALASCGDPIGDWLNPTPEEYTVYFLAGDGVSVPAQTVMEGELVTKPSDPKLLNYKFDGWFKDRECTTPWNFDTDKVERNTIIYAKWVECTHSGGEATCTKGAVCEICGATYTEPLGHKGGEANCTDGAICEVCGKTYTNPLGHKGGEATCEDKAVCEVCGKEYGEALGHLPGEAVKENEVAPTCTEAGSYDAVIYCEDCGEEVSRETVTVEALGHTEAIDEAVEPTCTEAGLTEGKHCSVCGEVLVAQEEVEATGHIPGAAVKENEVEGGCLAESSHDTVFYCSVCEIELQRDTTTVPAPGHKDNDNDDYCDACGDYLKTLTNVHINISNLTSITDNTELVPGTGISATTRLTLEGHNKDMGCSAFSMRLKLNGTMSVIDGAVDRGIKIVTNGPATIVVYAISGSKDATRTLRLVTLEEDTLVDVAIDEGVIGTDIGRYEFAVTEEGTYYLGSKSSGINLYYIAILYTAEENPHQCNNLCEICGKCLNEACTDELCADKCQGHHECEHVCEECGKCTDAACTEDVCADKCQGHAPAHVCESPCEICGKCTDTCEDDGCKDNKCQGHEEDDSVHVLDVTTDLAEMAQGAKADGETEVIGGYFTIHYSAKTKIDGSSKTWEDGYSATQRINWGGTSSVKTGNIKNAIEFVVTGKTTVKIWWVSGGDGRTVDIVDIDGTLHCSVGSDSVKNTQYYHEITLESAGTYYIAGLAGSNYIFKVEVAPYVAPAHECEHKCEVCGKCTDECEEEACAEKCEGHVPPVDLTPVVGEYLKYDGNDCYTFDKESYLEEITFTYENVSTNTYQNVNTWIKDKAAGKATLDLYIVNNGTETVYVTVKLEAAGAVALAEQKVYVAAGEVASVTLNFTGEAEMLYFFIDTGWSENTTSHSGSVTVAGVRFSEKSSDEPAPSYDYTDLYVEFKTENNYTITTTDTYVNNARISYADMAKNSWSNINIWIADKSAGCSVFSMKLTNHGAKTVSVWVQMKDANGVELINENVNIAAGAEDTFVFEYTGEGQLIFFFVDSTHMAAEDLNTGDITISEIKLGKVPAVEEPAHECEHKCEECGKCTDECEEEACADKCLCNAPEMEEVTYSLNIGDLETGVRSADEINSKFTIVSGSEVRNRTKTYDGTEYTKSVKIGNSTTKILVDVPGTGTLSFLVQNGSSGVEMQFITVTAPDGTVYDIEFVAGKESNPVVKIDVEVTEGVWTISRGKNNGTQDIFALSLTCNVEVSAENGFELVTPGKVDYLAGQDIDLDGLRLNATFASGKTDPLDVANVTVDTSAYNKDVAGEYTITVSYKNYTPITYTVTVYAPEEIVLNYDAIEKLPQNTSAGNGVYYNHSWKELYLVGEELDTAGLSVIVVGKCGEKSLEFRIADYEIAGFDSSYSDYNILTISACGLSTEIVVHVVDTTPTANEEGVYQLLVDPAYEGLAGVISGPYHVFRTIQQALDYAEHIDKSAVKELNIAPGTYNEKLEITVPNLHIIGWGATPDEVVIEWDSLYGLVDGGGFTHTTDSTQTVAIRESAYNVTIENITISNYWNSQDRMNAAKLDIERGLALLVQADRFVMKNSRLLGIQDTLELFTGRQYFENVFISGYTDFIFGSNNTTYFKNCTIHVIDTIKDDNGTAGYITAFKGSNKGEADAILYGAIFDGCKFTADEGVMQGKTAIGRTWGAYAAVAVINSELGGHISTAGYSSTNKNERYIAMNGLPTAETVKFVEYNNTGAGAITEPVAGMRMLTAEEAALYADFATIFGVSNGKVTYLDPWNPASTEVVVDDREYYYFNGQEGSEGTSYTYTDNIQGTIGTFGNLTIDATKGKLTARGSDSQFNAGAKIIFNVEAGTLVTVISYPNYGFYTINGIAHNATDTFSVYFAEATEVVIEATATSYIYQIIINPNEEAPEAATLNEVKVEGMNKDYVVGDELSLEGVVVKAYYSDYSVVVVTDYTVDATAVNNAVAGEYDVVFSFGGKAVTVKVTFEAPDADPRKDVNMTFGSAGNWADGDPAIDLSGITVNNNGGNNSQVKEGTMSITLYAGATLTIKGYSGYTDYTLSDGTTTYKVDKNSEDHTAHVYTAATDVVVTITVTSGSNYFHGIEIKYPAAPVYVEGEITFGSAGNYSTFEGIDISNIEIADNGGNNSQVKNGYMTFNVKAGMTVVIHGYPGYTSYKLNDSAEIAEEYYTYNVTADETITITPVSGNNYFYSITVAPTVNEEPEEPEEINYVLNVGTDITAFAKETKTDGETEVINNFFTIHYGKNSVVESNSKTFSDGFQGTQRFTLGGGASTTKCCVEITVTGNVVVKIWWVSGGDNRQMTVYDGDKNVIVATSESVKNALYITEFELAAGTYYIGGDTGSNYIYQMQVTSAVAGEPEEPETPVEPEQPEEVNHVLNVGTDITAFAKETKTDGETEVINNFFTIHYGKNSVVESNSKTFSDGFQGTQRFTLGGGASTTKCCVEITVTEGSVVKIWWVSGGDNRQMTVYDGDKNVIVATSESVKNALYITEFELAAGTYYIGGDTGSNYIYQMQVTTK